MSTSAESSTSRVTGAVDLSKFAWVSVGAAIATIALKTGAWLITGSVGLLSDAAESTVNLVAAVVALIALKVAASPATAVHHYGRAKAEYFSAAVEGFMIFVAAIVIIVTSVDRFVHPRPLENVGVGLTISVVASVVNGAVAALLIRKGRQYRSATLSADGRHLVTDVYTSAGVIVGVLLVGATGVERLDPVVGFLVGVNIIVTGSKLLHESMSGLLDESMSSADHATLIGVLQRFVVPDAVAFHALRTRVSGQQRFAEVHVLVPGAWTVQAGHDLTEDVEQAVRDTFDGMTIVCHLEPIEDPKSYEDIPSVEVPVDFPSQARGGEDFTI